MRQLGGMAAGAAAGAGVTGLELASGQADPAMSTGAKLSLLGSNTLLGGLLGNKNFRSRMYTQPAFVQHPAGRSYQVGRNGRWLPAVGTALTIPALPKLVNYGDAGATAVKALRKGINDNADNPDGYARLFSEPGEVLSEAINPSIQQAVDKGMGLAKDAVPLGISAFAANAGGSLGGGVLGHILGGALGDVMAADDKRLDYEGRRGRERWRNILKSLGTFGGGVGGLYLANKYHPQLMAATGFDKQTRT